MYFCTFNLNGSSQLGMAQNSQLQALVNLTEMWPDALAPTNVGELITKGDVGLAIAAKLHQSATKWIDVQGLQWLAPIPKPHKNIFCVGRNYREHIIEGNIAQGREPNLFPEFIELFTKAPTAVIGHGATIPLHAGLTAMLDYEAELAIVIGKGGVNITEDNANDAIFGFTILNDVTGREIQRRHGQWFKGKSLDGSCPIGPWVAHKSAIVDPHQLAISLKVNGEQRQNGNTSTMIFTIPRIIAELSAGLSLEPGDIIATGTPSGVGYAMKPPRPLKTGDVISIEIEGLGKLENTVGA
jgi:2-keto-4-pentenoate hydratase/2-oxohepta-3-ene-1,7-dioic acid hydratase in catechol pathway